jgi:hypothetical protein
MPASEGLARMKRASRTVIQFSLVFSLLGVAGLIVTSRPSLPSLNTIGPALSMVLIYYFGVLPFVLGAALLTLTWILEGFLDRRQTAAEAVSRGSSSTPVPDHPQAAASSGDGSLRPAPEVPRWDESSPSPAPRTE